MVPEDSHRIPRDPCYSGYCYHSHHRLVRDFHPLRFTIPSDSNLMCKQMSQSYNPDIATRTTTVWALPRSLATTRGIIFYFLFLQVLRCFSSLRSPSILLYRLTAIQADGLSHSETRASTVICTSTRIIAAYHVLHRL